MKRHALIATLASALVASALCGCATPPVPDLGADAPHCRWSHKRRSKTCTSVPVPSLAADAEAKRFAPDPGALTVYVVRRNWADGRALVTVRADGGSAFETLPETMVRMKLAPGRHTIAFEFEGQPQATTIEGQAGELRFVRIEGVVWTWKSSFSWAAEPEAETRARASEARLVGDAPLR